MSVVWLVPAALAGLALAGLPIAIHWLTRQQARTLPFPSLRFLQATQLASLKRRAIEDIWLLACRVLIVAVAALAVAGPVFQSHGRSLNHAARVSRAVVVIGAAAPERTESLRAGAFRFATLHREAVADAIGDAVRWLDAQPASAREITFVGRLRRGDVNDGDLRLIPATIGVRFDAIADTAPTEVTIGVLARRNGSLVRIDRPTHLGSDVTRVRQGETHVLPADTVSIVAADQSLATAALNAVLDVGVPWGDFDTKVVIAWEGADVDAVTRAAARGARVVSMAVPQPLAASADALMRVLRAVSPAATIDPVPIPDEQLRQWSRAAGVPSPEAPLVDDGDRRWLWLGVLLLLMVEWRLRQPRPRESDAAAIAGDEVRVA